MRELQKGSALIVFVLITLPVLVVAGLLFYKQTGVSPEEQVVAPIGEYNSAKEDIEQIDEKINGFSAKFEIYTHGTKRVFTSLMYHNLSSDVYISEPDPGVVHVKKIGTTWDDFFKTLPLTLTKDCLTTGDGESFCNDENTSLVFELNGVNTADTLQKTINKGDQLIIKVE